jgi:hypothetical protein
MQDYYKDKLSAERLKKCYDIAPQRVRQYLDAEINYVLQKINKSDLVIELGADTGDCSLPLPVKLNRLSESTLPLQVLKWAGKCSEVFPISLYTKWMPLILNLVMIISMQFSAFKTESLHFM